jgi:hypothetical protein
MMYEIAGSGGRRQWPEVKMSPENLDRIVDSVTDGSLAGLRQASGVRQRAAAGRRNQE